MFLPRCVRWFFFFLLCLATLPPSLPAAQVAFSWLPNTEPTLAGYKIYYGTSSGNYTNVTDVGFPPVVDGRVQADIDNLTPGKTYYFAATAYDSSGVESDYSNEVSTTVPETTPPPSSGQAEFSWLPNTEPTLAGYRIHYGTASRTYTATVDVGLPQPVDGRVFATVTGLTEGETYFFAATAYAADGTESDYSDEVSFTVPMTGATTPPVAVDGSATGPEDSAITGHLEVNSSGDLPLQYTVRTAPASGTVSIEDATGLFTYTPLPDFSGSDTFTFTATDGAGESNTATITITVTPVNDVPVATGSAITLDEDTTATAQLSASDADGDILAFSLATPPARGTVAIAPAGSFTYTPAADANGTDTFTFTVNDGTTTSTPATVTVTINPVNDPPVAGNTAITLNEDGSATGQLTATDPDGDTLAFALATPPARGTVAIAPAGSFTYTPAADANGTDTFTFTVSDGTATSTPATVTVTINPVNDPPVADNTAITVDQGAALNGNLTASDRDGDPLTFILVSTPAKGSVHLATDGSFTYQANDDATGTDTFSFKVSDEKAESSPATVTVNINEVIADFHVETGELQLTSAWQKINFDTSFLNPVVIARATSLNDPEPGVIRIRNVTTTGFELRFQEWDSLDDVHPAETVTYMVMEQGSFTLDDGSMVEAGCFPATTTGTFVPVALTEPMHRVPVVMTALDTVNETDAVTTRIRNITATGFEVMMQEQEANPAEHAAETGCFIAWEPSSGTIGTMLYEVAATSDEITHNAIEEKYATLFPTPPLLLAEMQSTDGPDTAVLRVSANSVAGTTLLLQEEQSRDSEQYHTTETAGMIAVSTIDPAADPDGDGLSTGEETATYHTHPGLADSDNDGMADGREVTYWQDQGTSWNADPDGDGLVNLLDPDADGDGIPDGTEVAAGTDPGDPASGQEFPTIDAGEIELDHNWIHVELSTPFTRPVIVARLVSRNGWDPSVLRITNVTPTGFDIRLQEYDYLDGSHFRERVNYLVMEAGHYTLSDGTQIEAGTFENQAVSSFAYQGFTRPFSRVPVVVTAIVSTNETATVTGRLRNIGLAGFDFRMQEQELNPQVHAPESVAYIAWEPSTATIAGISFAVGRSMDSITASIATIAYDSPFARQPLLVAAMQTTDGGDTASLRITEHTADAMQVMVEEERSRDSETSHTTEVAGYIAILAE